MSRQTETARVGYVLFYDLNTSYSKVGHVCLSVRPPDCLSVRPSVLLLVPMYLSIFRSIVFGTSSCFCFFCPSACLSRQTCLLVRLLVFQPACLSAHPPACLLVCLPVCLLARMSASLPACTSAYLSVFCLPSCIPAHPPSPRFFPQSLLLQIAV